MREREFFDDYYPATNQDYLDLIDAHLEYHLYMPKITFRLSKEMYFELQVQAQYRNIDIEDYIVLALYKYMYSKDIV